MPRYDISRWADFVRGLLPREEAARMERFLDSEAPQSERKLVASMRRLVEAAEAESRYRPPEYAVRSVEGYFRQQQPASGRRRSAVVLELTFDSALAPAPSGARSIDDATRQLLFQSDTYALDLRIAQPDNARKAIVVGQLLRRLGEPMTKVPVYLSSRGKVVSTAFTGEFGSFHLEGGDGPIELRMLIDDDQEIRVALDPDPAAATEG